MEMCNKKKGRKGEAGLNRGGERHMAAKPYTRFMSGVNKRYMRAGSSI